jgi:hypothetical protein
MMPPVGKSGPVTSLNSSSSGRSGRSIRARTPPTISVRLCGGIVGGHADRDAGGAVQEQVRDLGRQDRGLELLVVVVRLPVDGLLVEIGEQLARDLGHPALGVPHGRRRIAVDRAEVALAVDEHVAHREVLGHADQGVVDRGVAVRVILADDVADHAGALQVRPVPDVVQALLGEQDPAVHRLHAIAGVGQRAGDDDAHRVVHERGAHLLFDGDRRDVGGGGGVGHRGVLEVAGTDDERRPRGPRV